ncbi:MAG: hypothetical protein NTY79_02750 [Chloroflexi bacterium]|nr:hypothetical protein [Chloroflexota bacterium]
MFAIDVSGNGKIQNAIDGITADGTINVDAGTYSENLTISKNLNLEGAGAPDTIIDGGGIGSVLHIASYVGQTNIISGFTIQNGHAVGAMGVGGGVYVKYGHIVTLNDCTIKNNIADLMGGGIYNSGQITLNRCTLSGNYAGRVGGGIANFVDGYAALGYYLAGDHSMSLTNCTIYENNVGTPTSGTGVPYGAPVLPPPPLGGGIYNGGNANFLNVTIDNNTVSANPYPHGGGFANKWLPCANNPDPEFTPVATFENTIVAQNVPENGYNFAGSVITSGHNISSDNTCYFLNFADGDMINTNPLLGLLQDNGGPTFTQAITIASPAFNVAVGGPDTDQRGVGFPRPMLNGYDIGAYELQRILPPTVTSVNPNSGIQGQTLDVIITGNNFTGATSVTFGALGSYVSVNSRTVDNDNQITANITISSYASPGTRDVTVTTPWGTNTLNDGFTVNRAGQQTQTVNTATGTGVATFTTSGGSINNLRALITPECGALAGYSFPQGFFSFTISNLTPGSTVILTITLPSNMPADTKYWKCINGQWMDITSMLGDNDGDNVLTLTLRDGGPEDADGHADGTITDPGAPATPVVAPTVVTPATPAVTSTAPEVIHTRPPSSSPYIPPPLAAAVALPNVVVQSASLSISKVTPGAPVIVDATLVNKSTVNGALNVKLYVNGREEASQGVTVNSGSTLPVSFNISRNQPGTYSVYVGGVSAGSFTVDELADPNTILYISGALLGIAFVIGLLLILRRRQRGY